MGYFKRVGNKICYSSERISQCCDIGSTPCGSFTDYCKNLNFTGNLELGRIIYKGCYDTPNDYDLMTVELVGWDIRLIDLVIGSTPFFSPESWSGCRLGSIDLKYTYRDTTETIIRWTQEIDYLVGTTCIDGVRYVYFTDLRLTNAVIDTIYLTDPPDDPFGLYFEPFFTGYLFYFDPTWTNWLPNPYYNPSHPPGYETYPKLSEPIPNMVPFTYENGCEEIEDTLSLGGYALVTSRLNEGCVSDLCLGTGVIECQSCDNPKDVYYVNILDRPSWARTFRVGSTYYLYGGPIVEETPGPVDEWLIDWCPNPKKRAYMCDGTGFITYDETTRPDLLHNTLLYEDERYYITSEVSTDPAVAVEWSTGICPVGDYAIANICIPDEANFLTPSSIVYRVDPNLGAGNGIVKLFDLTPNPSCPADAASSCVVTTYYLPTTTSATGPEQIYSSHTDGLGCRRRTIICGACGPAQPGDPSTPVDPFPESPEI